MPTIMRKASKSKRNESGNGLCLSEIEKETIRRHMFPLNPIPPRCREAWIVTLADKICSGGETVEGLWEKFEEIRNPS